MSDPNIYLSKLLGLEGVYVLISSFHDDEDGEKYIYKFGHTNLARQFMFLLSHIIWKVTFKTVHHLKIVL